MSSSSTKKSSSAISDETTASTESQASEESATDVANGIKKVFNQKVDGGKKSAWAMTLETFGMSDGGKAKKTDVIVDSVDDGLQELKVLIDNEVSKKPHVKWDMDMTKIFLNIIKGDHTIEDVYRAFLIWSKKDPDDVEEGKDKDTSTVSKINVSKAYRRLEAYVTWMDDNRETLDTKPNPISIESLTPAAKAWNCLLTHDKVGRIVWWMDFETMDLDAIKSNGSVPLDDSLRYVVWLSHLILLDVNAQSNGMIIVEAMAFKGMWEVMTMFPMDLGTKLDRLTIGTLPIKMKACYILNSAKWLNIMMALIKPFMSKKMRQRMIMLQPDKKEKKKKEGNDDGDDKTNTSTSTAIQQRLEDDLGVDCIPKEFGGVNGTCESDIIFGHNITN